MVWYFVNNLGLHRELQEWLMKKLQEIAEQKGKTLNPCTRKNLWMMLIPGMIVMRKARASQSYKTNLGSVSWIPFICLVGLSSSCLAFDWLPNSLKAAYTLVPDYMEDLHSTTSSKFVPCLHWSTSHPTCQDWGKLMHNLPSRSVVPTLGFRNPSATQLQNCWHTGFEYVGELDMSPLASMIASDFISWELLA